MTKNWWTAALIAAVVVGVVLGRFWLRPPGEAQPSAQQERRILYWQAPMDPNYRRDEPGKSPMGMDLIPVYANDVEEDRSVVSIDPVVVQNLGVRTAPAAKGVLSRRVETVGYVGYDEDTLHQINTRVEGWIETLSVKSVGERVSKGQVLFELYSPTLVNAQEEHLAALQSGNAALHEASMARLRALGVTAEEIDELHRMRKVKQRIAGVAQTNGFVADLGVREGMYVTPNTRIMSIARLDRVWVLAEVFERQAAWVREGQRAEVELDFLPGEQWPGRVDYVYPELDPKTRTLTVRLRFDNPGEVLRPNMFARVTIHGTETQPVVHVPREGVIRGGAVNRVVVALGGGRFRAQPVELGIESGDRVEIRSGVSEGDPIVTSGQFLIDSESNIDAALARMAARSMDEPVEGQSMDMVEGQSMNMEDMNMEDMNMEDMNMEDMNMEDMNTEDMNTEDMNQSSSSPMEGHAEHDMSMGAAQQ
ncbi:MAG: efflux RND transporter periplasmic adaptor subunit [Gammaproteobacteria bacterium]|jgi:Cu(I)/Ag(I) efflux system membrane fusion protein